MITNTGHIPNLVGFSMDASNKVHPMSAQDKHLQQVNLKRMQLQRSLKEPELSNELAKFEASLIESKSDYYDLATD